MRLVIHKDQLNVNCTLKLRHQLLVHGSWLQWQAKMDTDFYTISWYYPHYSWYITLQEYIIIKEDIIFTGMKQFPTLINGDKFQENYKP